VFKLPRPITTTLLAIHGWSGILLGLLLYAVICTGVAAVFASEINNWASPLSRGDVVELPATLDDTITLLAALVDPQYPEEVAAYRSGGGRLLVFFHRHDIASDGKPSEYGVEFAVDPDTQSVLARREGWYDDIAALRRSDGIADFLVDLHVRLHIPEPYGLFVTGILGMAMMTAAITGLLIHRHLFKELFTLRLRGEPVLRRRDLHVVGGAWNLPFAFILAFTGSFFSFATTIGLPLVANATFAGDQERLIETLYGAPHVADATPVRMANLNAIVADAKQRASAAPYFVAIERYGRADSAVWVYTLLPDNRVVYSSHLYRGASGEYITERPPLGQQPSFGASLVGLMYPLHFGYFAGVLSKWTWVALGFAGAYVTLTGMLLWTRRRIEQPAWRRIDRLVRCVGYGLPLALACAPYAHFATLASNMSSGDAQGIAFLSVAVIVAALTLALSDVQQLRRTLLGATGVALLGLPLARMLAGGPAWVVAWEQHYPTVIGGDCTLLAMGIATLWGARARVTEKRRAATTAIERGEAQSA
jgi:uncharacterized iron-regulated membrane protein